MKNCKKINLFFFLSSVLFRFFRVFRFFTRGSRRGRLAARTEGWQHELLVKLEATHPATSNTTMVCPRSFSQTIYLHMVSPSKPTDNYWILLSFMWGGGPQSSWWQHFKTTVWELVPLTGKFIYWSFMVSWQQVIHFSSPHER